MNAPSEKTNKQKLLIEYLVSSPDTYALCKSITCADYFDPTLRKTVEFVHEYYDKYNTTPNVTQIAAETDVLLNVHQITKDQIEYCANEIESFCKWKGLQKAIYAAPDLIKSGDYGAVEQMIREAIAISLNKDIGIDYFADPFTRLEEFSKQPSRTSTGWKVVDDQLCGGLARTEMILFSANSGGGKSITLANLALNFIIQKFNVLYLSLELSEPLISSRFDTMLTGIPSILQQQKFEEIASGLSVMAPHLGKLVIKHMPSGTNANSIRSYLKEFELTYGYVPDMLVVDYIDIMGANEKVSADNIWEKDKRAAEQLRDIGFEYNMFIATASQQNRAALDAEELHQGHIAGGISKVNTVDVHISILLTSAMKAQGEIGFFFMKTRNSDGVGKTVYLKWDNTQLRIMNLKKDIDVDEDGVIIDKVGNSRREGEGRKPSLGGLLDMGSND